MRQYIIDELRLQDFNLVKNFLAQRLEASGVEGLYWVPLPNELLTDFQATHTECGPLFFAVTLELGQLTCELLLRTRKKIHCDCMAYATQAQRNWIIEWADAIFEQLGLHT